MFQKRKINWPSKSLAISIIWSVLLFSISIAINSFANDYANRVAQNTVTDLILSNTAVWNVGWITTYGVFALIILLLAVLIVRPKQIPFTLKTMALFVITRAVFMSLTHIAQFTPQAPLRSSEFFNFFGGGNQGGLFFSGHTGLPFLLALIFWKYKKLGLTFLFVSIIFGVSLLLGHFHYSIDVFGAFFITYTIFILAKRFFAKDLLLFELTPQ